MHERIKREAETYLCRKESSVCSHVVPNQTAGKYPQHQDQTSLQPEYTGIQPWGQLSCHVRRGETRTRQIPVSMGPSEGRQEESGCGLEQDWRVARKGLAGFVVKDWRVEAPFVAVVAGHRMIAAVAGRVVATVMAGMGEHLAVGGLLLHCTGYPH